MNVGLEEQLLIAAIRESSAKIPELVDKAGNENAYGTTITGEQSEEAVWADESLEFALERFVIDLITLAERLGLPIIARRIADYRASLKSLDQYEMNEGGYFTSDIYRNLNQYFDSMASMVDGMAISGLGALQAILENTSNIISDGNLDPQNESEINQAIRKVVKYAFHGVVGSPKIPKLIKTYKPEFGVPSLKAAVEYKFAIDEDGVKRAFGGFYEDMRGYYNTSEYQTFFAVLYTTEKVVNQKIMQAEFKGNKADMNWIPILVHGTSSKPKKAKLPAKTPSKD